MKTLTEKLGLILALAALCLTSGCTTHVATSTDPQLSPIVGSGATIATSLAVNAYPLAAPFVEMAANSVRELAGKRAPTPAELSAVLDLDQIAVNKVAPLASADVAKLNAAVLARYTAAYPKIVAAENELPLVEEFAQAVEKGA